MGEYFVHSEQMTVGYDGKPLIKDIEIRLNRGDPDSDRTERCRKVYDSKESDETVKADQRNGLSRSGTDEPYVRKRGRT